MTLQLKLLNKQVIPIPFVYPIFEFELSLGFTFIFPNYNNIIVLWVFMEDGSILNYRVDVLQSNYYVPNRIIS